MIGSVRTRGIRVEVLWWGLSVLAFSPAYSADLEQALFFDIGPQPLESALLEFSRQTKFQVLTASTDLAGHDVRGVQGEMSVRVALDLLLAGTGLVYRKVGAATISVSRSNPPANDVSDSPRSVGNPSDSNNETIQESNPMKKSGFFAWFAALFTACGGGSISREACAQSVEPAGTSQLEEIIVTAQKREENLQQTAVAVSAISADTIASLGATTLSDIGRLAPNTQFGNGQFGASLFIRGIGQQQTSYLSDPGATLYVDGVYRPRIDANTSNFSDVQRIEVLRGPQGTLFGKNAIGGAVNVITAAPGEVLAATLGTQYGSRDRLKVDASANLPIIADKLAARFAVQSNKQDGYMNDLATGEKLSDTDYYTTRAAVRWNATDDVVVTVRGDYTWEDQKGSGLKLLAPASSPYYSTSDYETYGTAPSYLRTKDAGASATLDWSAAPGAFKSITAYREYTYELSDDVDATPLPIQHAPQGIDEHFVSQELQYSAQAFDDRFNWTVGGYFLDDEMSGYTHLQLGTLGVVFDNYFAQHAKSYAAFGQGTFSFTDKLSATVGLRYSRDDKDVSFASFSAGGSQTIDAQNESRSWSAVTKKLTLQYQFTPSVMSYATASQGFKSGGYNGTPLQPSDFRPFDQELAWNYELGLKSEWLQKRLRANLTVYWMDYTGIQTTIDRSPQLYIANAGDARINGVEAELAFLPVAPVLLSVSFGSNDFKYTRLSADAQAQGIGFDDGVPNSPKYTVNGGAEYTVELGNAGSLVLRTDYAWRSKIYFDAFNTESTAQHSYGLWSARFTYHSASDRWSAYAYGLNLGDTAYRTVATQALGNTVAIQGAPREVGIGVGMRFGG